MDPINEIDIEELKSVITTLNDAVIVDPISTDTDDTDGLLDLFIEAIARVPKEKEEELPAEVVSFYNNLYEQGYLTDGDGEDAEPPEGAEAEAKEKEEAEKKSAAEKKAKKNAKKTTKKAEKKQTVNKKAEKKAPEKKKAAPTRELNSFGHVVDTQAARIDDELVVGGTLKDIAAKVGVKPYRVKAHALHLENDKGVTIKINGDVYKVVS